jgi:hypothetical protein
MLIVGNVPSAEAEARCIGKCGDGSVSEGVGCVASTDASAVHRKVWALTVIAGVRCVASKDVVHQEV